MALDLIKRAAINDMSVSGYQRIAHVLINDYWMKRTSYEYMALMSVWLMIACHQPVASSSRALLPCACMFVCVCVLSRVNYCTLHSYETQPYTCVIELGNHLIALLVTKEPLLTVIRQPGRAHGSDRLLTQTLLTWRRRRNCVCVSVNEHRAWSLTRGSNSFLYPLITSRSPTRLLYPVIDQRCAI